MNADTRLSTPVVGFRVMAMNHRVVGEVSGVMSHAFAVRLANGRSAWLSRDVIFTVDDGLVTLVCNAPRLAAYLAMPDARPTPYALPQHVLAGVRVPAHGRAVALAVRDDFTTAVTCYGGIDAAHSAGPWGFVGSWHHRDMSLAQTAGAEFAQ